MKLLSLLKQERLISYSEERKFVEAVKKLPLSYTKQIEIILLYRDLKIASEIMVTQKDSSNGIKEFFLSFGLVFKEGTYSEPLYRYLYRKEGKIYWKKEGFRFYPVFYFSKKEEYAKELKNLIEEKFEEKNCKRFGELFGFPKTAILAYEKDCVNDCFFGTNGETMRRKDEPTQLKFCDFMRFAQFRFSRKYWKKEIETAKKWRNEIWRIAPELYLEFLKEEIPVVGKPCTQHVFEEE
jgi:hypothetical protein